MNTRTYIGPLRQIWNEKNGSREMEKRIFYRTARPQTISLLYHPIQARKQQALLTPPAPVFIHSSNASATLKTRTVASEAVLASFSLSWNPAKLCSGFHTWHRSSNNRLWYSLQIQKRTIQLLNKKNNAGVENVSTKKYKKTGSPSLLPEMYQQVERIANDSDTTSSATKRSGLFASADEAFDLSSTPIPLKRKAQLARLQTNLNRGGGIGLKNMKQALSGRRKALEKMTNSTNSLNLPLSYFPPELRHQEIERFIEQENLKRRTKEQGKIQDEKLKDEQQKAKVSENAKRSPSWVKTVRLALEIQKKQNPEHYQMLKRDSENETDTIRALQKEANLVPGLNQFDAENGDSPTDDHPFKIQWEFYCQAHNDWQKRLDQFYQEVMGRSTKVNFVIVSTLYALIVYYCIAGIFTTVYLKYNLVIRYQLIVTAGALSYCAGTIWGYAMGRRFIITRLKKSPGLALVVMVGSSAVSLWAAAFNYNIGFLLMDSSCLWGIGTLYWLRHRGMVQEWHLTWMGSLFGLCIVSMLICQHRANTLKAGSNTFIEESDLNDYFSITAVVKLIAPKWIKEIMFADETEIVTEKDHLLDEGDT